MFLFHEQTLGNILKKVCFTWIYRAFWKIDILLGLAR